MVAARSSFRIRRGQFVRILRDAGVEVIQTAYQAPNNAFAERWVKSVKDECLSQVIIFGQGHLERVGACSRYACSHDFHMVLRMVDANAAWCRITFNCTANPLDLLRRSAAWMAT